MTAGPTLVTGAAGFIGYHACLRLLEGGHCVHGLDNLNDAYDPGLKQARLGRLLGRPGFTFEKADLADAAAVAGAFGRAAPQAVLHLAAQAGVRGSANRPGLYAASNLNGFLHVLEGCRHARVRHLVYASSSSVYGLGTALPFRVHAPTDHPVSLYAATKKANELMAHSYAHQFGLPVTGVRLFTVYGPWGRPDMALFTFTRAILEGRTLDVYGGGRMRRDFTFVDDAVEALLRLLARPAAANPAWSGSEPDPASSSAPYRIYNVGYRSTVEVLQLIGLLEDSLGRRAVLNFLPAQECEVPASIADSSDLERDTGFTPQVSLEEGVRRFVAWYRDYHAL